MKTRRFETILILILGVTTLLLSGCREDEDTQPTPPPTPLYGTGSMSFTASGSGTFSANGHYLPSTEIVMETNGTGAGGFLQEMVIGGNRLKAEVMAYSHSLNGGLLDDRVFFFDLYEDSSGTPLTGSYDLVRPDTAATGKYAVATYVYFSNGDGLYHVYQSRSGSVTVSSIDPSTNHITGSFSGFLIEDTTYIQIVNGTFDVILTGEYFIYKPGIR